MIQKSSLFRIFYLISSSIFIFSINLMAQDLPRRESHEYMDGDDRGHRQRFHWTDDEDQMVMDFVAEHQKKNIDIKWNQIKINGRPPKSCRERYKYHLDKNINKAPLTQDEREFILISAKPMNHKWSKIAAYLPGRTPNQIKNFWHGHKRSGKTSSLKRKSSEANDLTDMLPEFYALVEIAEQKWLQMSPY